MHINLIVFDGSGTEPVHVEHLGAARYRLLYSPGFVDGVAAGDEIEVLDAAGTFRILRRGGNVAVHLFSSAAIAPIRQELERAVALRLAGRVDGAIERALVFTIPTAAGLPAIERFFAEVIEAHPGTEWSYNNPREP